MPGVIQRQRKRLAVSLSDDDEVSDASSVSVGSKRARYAPNASAGSTITNSHRIRSQLQNEEDDADEEYDGERWQPGSLVRVTLKNFVTYTAATFNPGPSLNMVIGPNGTGKSTLVCAICLGLGWSPEHLGRAKEIGAFVKHGSAEAEIEIELAGQEGKPNQVIRRVIRKEGNKSVFFHNNQHVPQKAVQSLARSFSIQIDNLCQFLPQDRVVEFAKLDPVELLRETQRAVAPDQMIAWHDDLKRFRGREKELQVKQQTEESHLKGLENQQNATRDDVRRWEERQELDMKRRALEKCRPIIELAVLKNSVQQTKLEMNAAKRDLEQINAEVEPVRRAQEEIEAYHGQIDQVVKLRKNRVDMAKTQAEQAQKKIDTEKDTVEATNTEVEAEVKAKKSRERDIHRVEGDITRLERQRQERPVEYDRREFEQRISECRTKINAASERQTDVDNAIKGFGYKLGDLNKQKLDAVAARERLDTQSGQQATVLSRLSPDTRDAWKWIQDNKSTLELKGEVYGPAILTCSVQDPKLYADAIESQLRKGDLVAITCTDKDDQLLLSNKLLPKYHELYFRTPIPLSNYKSPVPRDQLQNFGFSGYLIDYIKGPETVLSMLCGNAQLHRTAFAPKPISNDQHNAAQHSPIQKWVSGRETYQITTRREYAGYSSTTVTQLRKAKHFTDQPVNTEEKQRLEADIKRLEREQAELREQHAISMKERTQYVEEQGKWKEQETDIKTEQTRRKKAVAEYEALPQKIGLKKSELARHARENADTNNRIRAIKAKKRESSIRLAGVTLDYVKTVTSLRTFHESLVEAEIRLIEANSERKALKAENHEILRSQREKQQQIDELNARYQNLKTQYEQLRRRAQNDLNSLDDEEKEIVRQYRQITSMEELENEIQAVQARLEMMAEGNPHAIRKFEERARLIEQAQQSLEEMREELTEIQQQIGDIRAQWEPQLEDLVAKISDGFSHNFAKIGCAGQVSVYKDEDFENWSIQIQVRFRENESLSILDSHRQSGGERAVSTIFYLMALQDLARSPFRVVDEINQGMDPRNERMVHERMVDIACREHTSQYFLITPKLLPGLKYHPKMKVHCIASGEHMPDSKHNLNFKELAAIALRVKKGIPA